MNFSNSNKNNSHLSRLRLLLTEINEYQMDSVNGLDAAFFFHSAISWNWDNSHTHGAMKRHLNKWKEIKSIGDLRRKWFYKKNTIEKKDAKTAGESKCFGGPRWLCCDFFKLEKKIHISSCRPPHCLSLILFISFIAAPFFNDLYAGKRSTFISV